MDETRIENTHEHDVRMIFDRINDVESGQNERFVTAMNAIADEQDERLRDKQSLIVGIILAALPGWVCMLLFILFVGGI